MVFTWLLAHGILGPNDEVILPVVGGAFIGVLIITWLSSRNMTEEPPETPGDDPNAPPTAPDDDPSHYKLD